MHKLLYKGGGNIVSLKPFLLCRSPRMACKRLLTWLLSTLQSSPHRRYVHWNWLSWRPIFDPISFCTKLALFQPWDFLCLKFHELFFKTEPIPPEMLKGLNDYHLISGKPTHCMRYLLLLAETCNVRLILKNCCSFTKVLFLAPAQEIQALCPTKVGREVLSHALLFMWPK